MPRTTDILVVGAGPAGATAAYYAATAGISTLLIDRKEFPRSKVCGDGLTPRALRALNRMGVVDDSLVRSRISGMRFVRQGGSTVYSFATEPAPFNFGAVVPRAMLDDRIRLTAEGAGATFVANTTAIDFYTDGAGQIRGVWVEGLNGRELIESKVAIVADGAAGRLGRRLRGDASAGPYTAFALRQYWDGIADLDAVFEVHMPICWHGRPLLGYGWVFPVNAACANVGVGLLVEHKYVDDASLPEVLRGFVEDTLSRDPRFAHARPAGPIEAGPVNSRMADPSRTPPGALLVGDAAGLVNVFTAEGISYALESGELAALEATRSLQRQRMPTRHYSRQLIASYPRHWATRESSRHFRWLMALAPRLFETEASTELLRALRRIVLDEPRGVTSDPAPHNGSRATQWLLHSTRRRAVDMMRSTDRLLAELVEGLLSVPTNAATIPLTLATTIVGQQASSGIALVDSLAAIALLSLAQSLLEDVTTTLTEGDVVTTAAIVIGDCVTTEAIGALSRLPDASYRLVSDAFRTSASARLGLTLDDCLLTTLEKRYSALAAPTRCAATLAIEAMSPLDIARAAREMTPFATWYAATRMGAADLRNRWTPELATYLGTKVGAPQAPPPHYERTLQGLIVHAVREARESLACAPAAPAVTAR